jgi:hypothetical protein
MLIMSVRFKRGLWAGAHADRTTSDTNKKLRMGASLLRFYKFRVRNLKLFVQDLLIGMLRLAHDSREFIRQRRVSQK